MPADIINSVLSKYVLRNTERMYNGRCAAAAADDDDGKMVTKKMI